MKQQIELDFEGTKLGFHFGLGFLGELLDSLGFSIDELQLNIEKNPFKVIPKLMYTSYSYGGVTSEGVSSFLTAFTDSMTKDVPVAKNKIPTKGKPKASLKK